MNHPAYSAPSLLSAGQQAQTALSQQQTQALQSVPYSAMQQQWMLAMQPQVLVLLYPNAAAPPHEPTRLKSEAIVAGEIIAWRAWVVRNGRLYSMTASSVEWNPNAPMEGDAAGGWGVHAYKNALEPLRDGYIGLDDSRCWAFGQVALWGDVIEHERGYRAQYARVHALLDWSANTPDKQRAQLIRDYVENRAFELPADEPEQPK